MTKKVFKSLLRLLESKEIYYITLYTKNYYGNDNYYQYPSNVVFNGETLSFTMKNYRIWKDPINQPDKPTIYPNYKVTLYRKDIRSIDLYTPIIRQNGKM